jgi:spermidine synthase
MSKIALVKERIDELRRINQSASRWGLSPDDQMNFMTTTIEAFDAIVSLIEDTPNVNPEQKETT